MAKRASPTSLTTSPATLPACGAEETAKGQARTLGQAALSQVISLLGSQKNDWPATIEARRLFIERYPDDDETPSQLWYIGTIQQNQLGDRAAAEATYREFLAKYPDDKMAPQVCYYLGNLLYGTQTRFQDALEVFRMLVDRYPDSQYYPHGLYYGGECLMSMLEVDQARAMWRELTDKMAQQQPRLPGRRISRPHPPSLG